GRRWCSGWRCPRGPPSPCSAGSVTGLAAGGPASRPPGDRSPLFGGASPMTQSPRRASDAPASTDTPPPEMDGQFPGSAGGKTEAGQPGGASQATPRPADLGSAEADRKALESLPLPLVLQLEQACGRFEDSWRTAGGGTAPRIEDHLAPAAGQQDQAP